MLSSIVMVSVTSSAHWPASGVKVYSVVTVLFIAGDQEPVMLLFETVGRAGMLAPAQNGPTSSNVGVTAGLTVIVRVTSSAHWFASGVNVYSVVTLLLRAGDQLPVIPSSDEAGRSARASPAHIAPTALNVGVTAGLTVIVRLTGSAHWLASGVKV